MLNKEDLVKSNQIDITNRENYNYIIAGPMTMNRAYSKLLQEKGISKNNIYYEGFNF